MRKSCSKLEIKQVMRKANYFEGLKVIGSPIKREIILARNR